MLQACAGGCECMREHAESAHPCGKNVERMRKPDTSPGRSTNTPACAHLLACPAWLQSSPSRTPAPSGKPNASLAECERVPGQILRGEEAPGYLPHSPLAGYRPRV